MRLFISLSLLAAIPVAFFVACGGSSDDGTNTQTDAAVDATKADSSKADVAVQEDTSVPTECVDADLEKGSIQDAAIGETGATTASCVVCARNSCKTQLSACNDNCDCKNALLGFYDCQASGKSFNACATANLFGIPAPGDKIATALGQCVISGCADECGYK